MTPISPPSHTPAASITRLSLPDTHNTPNVFLEFTNDGADIGRIEIRLFDEVTPKTANNFRQLATGERGYGYRGSSVNKIVSDSMFQAGLLYKPITDADGKESLVPRYSFQKGSDPTFPDENYILQFVEEGTVAMASPGPNRNGSQFFITLVREATWLNGRHTVFGQVVQGLDVLGRIGALGRNTGHPEHGRHDGEVLISNCGIVVAEEAKQEGEQPADAPPKTEQD